MGDAMTSFFGSLDHPIVGEFHCIAEFIRKARDEISGLQPNDIEDSRIPGASMELDAAARDTECATENDQAGSRSNRVGLLGRPRSLQGENRRRDATHLRRLLVYQHNSCIAHFALTPSAASTFSADARKASPAPIVWP